MEFYDFFNCTCERLGERSLRYMTPSIVCFRASASYLTPTLILGSKITAVCDCSHEIKRRLLLGRKVMTNLDRILQSRDITLRKNVHLVKTMVFPVVMYGCESWTVKKAESKELMLLNCSVGEDSCESLGLQGDPTSPS